MGMQEVYAIENLTKELKETNNILKQLLEIKIKKQLK
jgi:hypothetical protein